MKYITATNDNEPLVAVFCLQKLNPHSWRHIIYGM